MELRWRDKRFEELSPAELYGILELRQRVFVVEQACAYLDTDGYDAASRHLWAETADGPTPGGARSNAERCGVSIASPTSGGARSNAERCGVSIVAYLRIVPAGSKYPELSLGRVVTAPAVRGSGLGRVLMQRGIALAGAVPIRIGAQAHLQRFYGELGFRPDGDLYDEDGIPHLEMVRLP